MTRMIYDDQTSSAMNYYEELGVAPDATEQEIRKAHRRLVKLMHPDAQRDQNMKMLAETQMRRLNSIVSTLLDSEQRRTYNDQLHASANPVYKQSGGPGWHGIPWWLASAVGAVVLTLAAVWLWADHLGNGSGRNKTAVYTSPSSFTPAQSSRAGDSQTGPASYKAPSEPPPSDTGISTAVVPDVTPESKRSLPEEQLRINKEAMAKQKAPSVASPAKPDSLTKSAETPVGNLADRKAGYTKQRDEKPAQVATSISQSNAKLQAPSNPPAAALKNPVPSIPETLPRKTFNMPAGSVVASAKLSPRSGGLQLPPPPAVSQPSNRDLNSGILTQAALPQATPPKMPVAGATNPTSTGASAINPRDSLEGEWVYAPKEPEKRKPGFYPPEFIVLKLFGAGDPGNLKGEYNAKYVVTDRPVSPVVNFELASISKDSRKFVWQSNNGTKGTLSIDPVDERTIKIDWHTTSAVHGPALTSGTATLVRRQ